MNRRRLLRQSGAAVAAGAVLGPGAARALAAARAAGVPAELGIQLYSLREVLGGDVNGTLDVLRRLGYRQVETAGTADRTPVAFGAALAAHGLSAPSGHTSFDALVDDADADAVFEAARAVGQQYVVIAWLNEEVRPDRASYGAVAERINAIGERARAAGLTLGYHNHAFEFETFGTDRPAYFDFVEALDPALVVMELDLYWTVVAGHDPVEIFHRYPGRFPLWHLKDGAGPEMDQTDVGAGGVDFPRIFAASETAGLVHAFIEADNPAAPLAFAEASIAYVESLRE